MKTLTRILAATACAIPLVATAQTGAAVQPADQPRTSLEKQQTTQNGQATKYGSPGTDAGAAATTGQPGTSTASDAGSTTMKHRHHARSAAAKPGETPAADGTAGTAGGTTPK